MVEKWMALLLLLASLAVLGASGNLDGLPILILLASLGGGLLVRMQKPAAFPDPGRAPNPSSFGNGVKRHQISRHGEKL